MPIDPVRIMETTMRPITILLAVLLIIIQYPLWLGKGGWLRVWELHRQLEAVQARNEEQRLKNAKLASEVQSLNEGTEAIRQLLQAVREQTAKQLPAPELIAKAAEEKVRAEIKSEEQAKELQVLQEENDRLRDEIKVLQEYKEKAHRELCRVRDEQKTIGKIKVNTEL